MEFYVYIESLPSVNISFVIQEGGDIVHKELIHFVT